MNNEPIYKIHGQNRRILKKELSLLKYYSSRFWYDVDLDIIHGSKISESEYKMIYNRMERKIKLLEIQLNEKYEKY